MEVTRSNFAKVLPEVRDAINSALFISIDAEYTGHRQGENIQPIDTPSEYYNKLRSSFLDFLLIQFGLAVFNYDEAQKKFIYKTYTFYLFPKPMSLVNQDTFFKLQSSRIDKMAKSKFNFNKVFREGISFMNQEQQDFVRDILDKKRHFRLLDKKKPEWIRPFPIPNKHKPDYESACELVASFMGNHTMKNLTLSYTSFYVCRMIIQNLRTKYKLEHLVFEKDNMDVIIRKPGSRNKQMEDENLKVEHEEMQLEEAIGFARLIEVISLSKKPVVGYSLMLDLMHIIKRFWRPLPEKYLDFKLMTHCMFSKVIDTRQMCLSKEFQGKLPSGSILELYQLISQPPFKIIEFEGIPDKSYDLSKWRKHNAGFDATANGIIYQTLVNYIGSIQSPPVNPPVLPDNPIISGHFNIVSLKKLMTYMNLDGPDPFIDRSHVFYVSFKRIWKTHEVTKLFDSSRIGGISVRWINDYGAVVTLLNKDFAGNVTNSLVNKCKVEVSPYLKFGYNIISYEEYAKSIPLKEVNENQPFTPAPRWVTFKKFERNAPGGGRPGWPTVHFRQFHTSRRIGDNWPTVPVVTRVIPQYEWPTARQMIFGVEDPTRPWPTIASGEENGTVATEQANLSSTTTLEPEFQDIKPLFRTEVPKPKVRRAVLRRRVRVKFQHREKPDIPSFDDIQAILKRSNSTENR